MNKGTIPIVQFQRRINQRIRDPKRRQGQYSGAGNAPLTKK